MRERERRERVCVREKLRRERECVREKQRRERVSVCVFVGERERENLLEVASSFLSPDHDREIFSREGVLRD